MNRFNFSEDYYEKTGRDPELLITNVCEPWLTCYEKVLKNFEDIEILDTAYNAFGDVLLNRKAIVFKERFDMDRLQEFWRAIEKYKLCSNIKIEMVYNSQNQNKGEEKRYQCINYKEKLILATISKDSIDQYKNIISDIPELYIEDIGYFIVDSMFVTSDDYASIVFKNKPDFETKRRVIDKYFSKLKHI